MLNNITIMGRLSDNPELRTTTSGLSVCSFTIANNKDFAKDGDAPNWVDCVAWRQTAEFISRNFQKGSMIIVTGSLQTRTYQDRNGNNRKAVEIVVNQCYFGESKRDSVAARQASEPVVNEAPVSYASAAATDFTVTEDVEDDLPF